MQMGPFYLPSRAQMRDMFALTNNPLDSHPLGSISGSDSLLLMNKANKQSGVGEVTRTLPPEDIRIDKCNPPRSQRVNTTQNKLAITQLTTKMGWPINLGNNMEALSTYEVNWAHATK